jgi:predicted nucleic acid-binding Zn ribbon protein
MSNRPKRIAGKVVEPRTCTVCGDPFTPRYVGQQTCPGRCSRIVGGRKGIARKTENLLRVVAQRRAEGKRRVEALCHQRWPELSVREIEIFNFAVKHGYRIGYRAGLAHQRRAARAAAVHEGAIAS